MKTKLFSLILATSLLFSLTACGNAAQSTAASVPSEAPQTFGASALETVPVQEAQTTTLPQQPDSSEAPAVTEATAADFTEQAVTAAIICDAMDALPYTPEDPMYIWRSVGYLIGQIGTEADLITMEGDFGHIAQDSAAVFAYAMDADFSGSLPSVTEEDPLIAVAEDGGYLINMLSHGDLSLTMTRNRYDTAADTCSEEAELFLNGESLGVYTVTLTAYTGGDIGRQYFSYSIQDISPK